MTSGCGIFAALQTSSQRKRLIPYVISVAPENRIDRRDKRLCEEIDPLEIFDMAYDLVREAYEAKGLAPPRKDGMIRGIDLPDHKRPFYTNTYVAY